MRSVSTHDTVTAASGPNIPSSTSGAVARQPARAAAATADATDATVIHAAAFIRALLAPDRLRQFVHPDDDPEDQAADEKPRRRAAPPIDTVADQPEDQNRADQRVAGTGRRPGLIRRMLQSFGR